MSLKVKNGQVGACVVPVGTCTTCTHVLGKCMNKAIATASVACGWAGAVMWGAGAVGGAVYMRASVTCDWAGAVMRKPPAENRCDGQTEGPTDRQSDL